MARVVYATAVIGAIPGDSAVSDRKLASIVIYAAANAGYIARDGAALDCESAGIIRYATSEIRAISRDGAVFDAECARVRHAATFGRRSSAQRHALKRQIPRVAHGHQSEGGRVPVASDRGAVTFNSDGTSNYRQTGGAEGAICLQH